MPRVYKILPGHTFDLGAGKTAGAGDEIELEDDVAALHAHRVEPVQAAVQTPAPDSGGEDTGAP